MNTRIVKFKKLPSYQDWLKENNYSLTSPKHRRYYAELLFLRACKSLNILAIRINKHTPILDQIPAQYLKKIQQRELEKLQKIGLDFFFVQKEQGFFSVLKMGTSTITKAQKEEISRLEKTKVFLFHVFEDREMLIKKIN